MIDGQWLVRKGQGNAAVMFNCVVMPNGGCFVAYTYRWTPGGEKLEQRVRRKLAEAQYIPAVYNHKTVTAALYGTVIFSVIEGKRRLRVFLNQEKSELAKESDFIAPQPVGVDEPGAPHKHPLEYPSKARYAHVSGVAVMKLSVDATGKLKDVSVESESPAGFGFGDVTLQAFREDVFLPAYRDGKPVDATTTLAVYFKD